MGGVNPHELTPLIVDRIVREWVVVERFRERFGLVDRLNAVFQNPASEKLSCGCPNEPRQAKPEALHFAHFSRRQVLADLIEIPIFGFDVS